MTTLSLTRPDDMHLHVRDGAALATTVKHSAQQFARAIIMPNLQQPVTTTALAEAYRQRIVPHIPPGRSFEPLMTLYLTDNTTQEEISRAAASDHVKAVKLYPAGATTHSQSGVTGLEKVFPVLEAMQRHDLPLLVHGEDTGGDVDIFDREKVFIERSLQPVMERFPELRIVFEHITTKEAVDFVKAADHRLVATLTPQHLLFNRNALLAGGIRPHYYCLPILKREPDRQALLAAATSGNPKFFLGTDSAPHAQSQKESACGCAGIYSAHAALELYAGIFEQADALDKLEGFASHFGADFYRLPRNTETITLSKTPWQVPEQYALGDQSVVPLMAGKKLAWRITG